VNCPTCDSKRAERRLEKNGFSIHVCTECGHGRMWPMPSESELKMLYSRNDSPNLENGLAIELEALLHDDRDTFLRYFADRLDALERFVPNFRAQRILDFGCASGLFVQALRYAGVDRAEGVDIIPELVARGRAKGLPLTLEASETFVKDKQDAFGLICANNVVEHLRDPARVLAELRAALAPGGHLYVGVPNFASLQVKLAQERSPIIDPPHHVHYFTPDSLHRLVERLGLEVLFVGTLFWGREADVYLVSKGVPSRLAAWCRMLSAPLKFGVERAGLGGIVQLVARRS